MPYDCASMCLVVMARSLYVAFIEGDLLCITMTNKLYFASHTVSALTISNEYIAGMISIFSLVKSYETMCNTQRMFNFN